MPVYGFYDNDIRQSFLDAIKKWLVNTIRHIHFASFTYLHGAYGQRYFRRYAHSK
jgi:hypothetical protein